MNLPVAIARVASTEVYPGASAEFTYGEGCWQMTAYGRGSDLL